MTTGCKQASGASIVRILFHLFIFCVFRVVFPGALRDGPRRFFDRIKSLHIWKLNFRNPQSKVCGARLRAASGVRGTASRTRCAGQSTSPAAGHINSKTDLVSIGSKFGKSMAHLITLVVVSVPVCLVFGWALSGPRRMRITRYLLNEIFEQR